MKTCKGIALTSPFRLVTDFSSRGGADPDGLAVKEQDPLGPFSSTVGVYCMAFRTWGLYPVEI